jgi:hypothetical protein
MLPTNLIFSSKFCSIYNAVALGIEARYEIEFLEIGTERERVHFSGTEGTEVQP